MISSLSSCNAMDDIFCPSNTAYVAVFDVATDTEIDTGKGEGSKKGIPLPIRNPLSIQYVAENNRIYIQGVGSYPGSLAIPNMSTPAGS